jgi:hypothetical protein
MTISRLASLRPAGAASLVLIASISLAACSSTETPESLSAEPSGPLPAVSETPVPTP